MIVGKGSVNYIYTLLYYFIIKIKDGVFIYNSSDPTNLEFLGHVSMEGDSDDIKYMEDDNYICTGSGLYGVAIINITDLRAPKLICTEYFITLIINNTIYYLFSA